ncbi:MAG: D-alanyl-D-alanine carboxypeptidase [Clostridia bacterium]|nr:D-alanyl-D-alanine carboxypeptidase [Clostridia bacterium]
MKKVLLFILLCALAFACAAPAFAAEPPQIDAKAAVLKETTTGTVLFEMNADEKLYPASITKLMTAIVALEKLDPASEITVSADAIDPLVKENIHAYLLPGEKIPFMNLLEYLLIPSGNDAANAFAVAAAGSIPEFVTLMNEKAESLGCKNTHFVNAHGLHDDNHYTTANDLLIIAEYAMQNKYIADTVKKTSTVLPVTNRHKTETILNTTNFLLGKGGAEYIYKGVTGIKTGSTTPAGLCLTASLEHEGLSYISVVLGAGMTPDGKKGNFIATSRLFDYAKKNFSVQTMIKATTPVLEIPVTTSPDGASVILLPQNNVSALLPNDFDPEKLETSYEDVPESLEAPVTKGQVVGTLRLSYGGRSYGSVPLVCSADLSRSGLLHTLNALKSFFTGKVFMIILGVLGAAVLAAIVWFLLANRKRGRGRRRKTYRTYKVYRKKYTGKHRR